MMNCIAPKGSYLDLHRCLAAVFVLVGASSFVAVIGFVVTALVFDAILLAVLVVTSWPELVEVARRFADGLREYRDEVVNFDVRDAWRSLTAQPRE